MAFAEPGKGATITIRLDREAWLRGAAAIILALVLLHLVGQLLALDFHRDHVFGLVALFDLDGERNAPAFLSACGFLAAAALAGLIAGQERRLPAGRARGWAVLEFLAAFLAADELFEIHERLSAPVRNVLHTGGAFHFAWVIPYAIALAGLALWAVPFLSGLSAATARRLIVAGVLYVIGALGLEVAGAAILTQHHMAADWIYVAVSTLEEVCEMSGIALFVHALLGELDARDFRIVFGSPTP